MDINEKAGEIVYFASKMVLDDLLWTFFGYKSRPLKGKLFTFFKNRKELNKIDFLAREFFIYALAIDLKKYNQETRQEIIDVIYRSYFLNPDKHDLSKSFGFKSKTELVLYLTQGLIDFNESKEDDFAKVLSNRFKKIMGIDFRNESLVGIARLNVHFEGW